MRVGMVLANHTYPPDIRVDKEASALALHGHTSLLLCKGTGASPSLEDFGQLTVVRHVVHPSSSLRRRLDSFRYLLTLDSASWRRAMVSLVRDHGAQALHVHDLPYVKSAVRAGRAAGVPVVLDLHENYPAALRLWRRRRIDRLLFSPARAERLERRAVRAVDRVIVVVDEARDRVIALGADPERVIVFGNTEPLVLAGDATPPLDTSKLHLVYVGGVARHRGLQTAVEAMPAILAEHGEARLTIVGDGDALAELKEQVVALGLSESVRFTGQLPKDEAMRYAEQATVAIVPHLKSPHTDATIPHKLFQYMALGRPVLVSDCAPLARIVHDTGSGEVFRSGDAADFAVRALALTDPKHARVCGAAGRAAVLSRYNLEAEAGVLDSLYRGLEG